MNGALFAGFLAAALRISTPLLLAGLGEMITERSGVLNLGIEGFMLLGAFVGFAGAFFSHSVWLGVLAAVVVCAFAGLLLGVFVISGGLNQHLVGLAATGLAGAAALYAFDLLFSEFGRRPQTEPMSQLLGQYPLTYLALILVPLCHLLLFDTPYGLRLRAVGEYPKAAESAGVDVYAMRYIALALGSGLIGAGGSFLSVAQMGSFGFGMVEGRGWVSLALVIFGNWSPVGILLGALLFGGIEALQMRLQMFGLAIPYQFYLASPYLISIGALTVVRRMSSCPAALLEPYRRG